MTIRFTMALEWAVSSTQADEKDPVRSVVGAAGIRELKAGNA